MGPARRTGATSSSSSSSALLALCALCAACGACAAAHGDALGAPHGDATPQAQPGRALRGAASWPANRTITAEALETRLSDLLETVHAGGDDGLVRRCSWIEAAMARTFRALPKNGLGRLAPPSVRHILHTYFAKEHGWQISGLEPHGMRTDMGQAYDVQILEQKAPAFLESLLEERESNRGLSLKDVAALAALLEHLILDESADILAEAYYLNYLDIEEPLPEQALHRVLALYLILFRTGKGVEIVADESTFEELSQVRRFSVSELADYQEQIPGALPTIGDLEQDAVGNFKFAQRDATNPFNEPQYSFQSASSIVNGIAEQYGKWQNAECHHMRAELMELDRHGSGKVPLGLFYNQPTSGSYNFIESKEYLRQIGALDEIQRHNPQVRIVNYLLGPSNCIASSDYFSVCCLNECDVLMSELEGSVQAPTAPAEHLLHLASNLSSSTVDAPRQLSANLARKLHSVAAANGGEVPLHGRLFAQWLHHAFPHECPYPHIVDNAEVLSTGYWGAGHFASTPAEREEHTRVAHAGAASEMHTGAQWSAKEVLPLQARQHKGRAVPIAAIYVMVVLAMGSLLFQGARSVTTASSRGASLKHGQAKIGRLPM